MANGYNANRAEKLRSSSGVIGWTGYVVFAVGAGLSVTFYILKTPDNKGIMPYMPLSPWLIVTIFSLVFAGLFYIGRHGCNNYVRGMALIAFSVVAVYSWIGIYDPSIELRALVVRYLFSFVGGGAITLILLYIKSQKGRK